MGIRLRANKTTGRLEYYNIDTGKLISHQEGEGLMSSVAKIGSKVAAKLTGQAARTIAQKAIEKGTEAAASKIGSKTGELIGEKIYNKFSDKSEKKVKKPPTKVPENKGDQIIELLQKHPDNKKYILPNEKTLPKKRTLSDEFNMLINM